MGSFPAGAKGQCGVRDRGCLIPDVNVFGNIIARKFSAIVILNEVKNLAQIVASRDEILRRSAQDDITRQRGNAAAIRRRAALPNLRLLDSFPRALARKIRVIGL